MIDRIEVMDYEEQKRLAMKQQKERQDEQLWQDLRIDFRLEAFRFPDNKIYGTIKICPESSRRLIQKLVLIVNKTNRIEFDPEYQHLSASGFNTNRRNPSAYIEAIPYNTKYIKEKKASKTCLFFFTGVVFALNPTISFDWSGTKAELVINWYHIGDKYAQKYILYLDNVEVQYIPQKLIYDAFDVRIKEFQAGEKHTFQIAARLKNGKEAYRSDLIEFVVPDKQLNNNGSIEFISVSDEEAPPNFPACMPKPEEKFEEDSDPNNDKEKDKPPSPILTCCKEHPHETFPGVEHYFKNITHRSLEAGSDDVITSND